MHRILLALALVLSLAACGGASTASPEAASTTAPSSAPAAEVTPVAEVTPSDAVASAVAAPDRTEADRALDAGRRPDQVLTFFRVAPGQRIAELFAGGGYTTELIARTVGAEGQVYAQNTSFILDRFARGPQQERLARLGMPNVVPVERELNDPLPPEAQGLDAVIFVLAYHDLAWIEGVDRATVNRAVFAALRPGGVYGIVDHNAEDGSGIRDVQTLHRIERQTVIDEVLAAGFVLDGELDALRNPEDARDWNASPSQAGERRGTSDRFVLRFVRPE